MKNIDITSSAVLQLTEKYGITLTELPERLMQKAAEIIGKEYSQDLSIFLEPLRQGLLRPARVRVGEKIRQPIIAEMIKGISALDGYDLNLAELVVTKWLEIFRVSPDNSVLHENADDIDDKFFQINDDISIIITDESVERVTNQFDDDSEAIVEPKIEDYDGHFSDDQFEIIADQPTVAEFNNVAAAVVQEKKAVPVRHSRQYSRNEVRPIEPGQVAGVKQATAYKLDDAFKALRDSDYELSSKIMMELARSGDIRAQFHLGEYYLQGTGVEVNNDKARYWFRKAAKQGSVPAKSKLMNMEAEEEGGGCLGGCFTVFMVVVVLKFLSSIL